MTLPFKAKYVVVNYTVESPDCWNRFKFWPYQLWSMIKKSEPERF